MGIQLYQKESNTETEGELKGYVDEQRLENPNIFGLLSEDVSGKPKEKPSLIGRVSCVKHKCADRKQMGL